MKSLKDITKHFQSPPATEQQPCTNGLVHKIWALMKATYGGTFASRVDTPETHRAWELSWTAALEGKNEARIVEAIRACQKAHPDFPFNAGHFERAYTDTFPQRAHRRNTEALALPSSTWQERREIAKKHITEAREILK